MSGCVFCRIAAGEAPAKIVTADENIVVFEDIAPRAPTHLLVIPRRHLESLAAAQEEDQALLGQMLAAAGTVARQVDVERAGYRIVLNTGAGAGQTVFHIHLHLLGGRPLEWPPG